MSAIKFWKCLTKFKITIALPKKFGSKGSITIVKVIKIWRSSGESLANLNKTLKYCIWKKKQEPHGTQFTHLSKIAIAYLQMPCNILPVLPQQLGTEIGQCRKNKGNPWITIWTNLVDLASSMLYTKIQPLSFIGSGEENFKCFFFFFFFCLFSFCCFFCLFFLFVCFFFVFFFFLFLFFTLYGPGSHLFQ